MPSNVGYLVERNALEMISFWYSSSSTTLPEQEYLKIYPRNIFDNNDAAATSD